MSPGSLDKMDELDWLGGGLGEEHCGDGLARLTLGRYKLVVVPADYVMDAESAETLREYVRAGGTVVMTAMSAKVDEHSNWFGMPTPGRLSDVFGLRTEEFYRPKALPVMELSGKQVQATVDSYEVLEPRGAEVLARFVNTPERSPAVTVNRYGKGKAIYLAVPAQSAMLGPLVESLYAQLGIPRGPATPKGVYARVVEGRTPYVNTMGEAQSFAIEGTKRGVLHGQTYVGSMRLAAYDAELLQ